MIDGQRSSDNSNETKAEVQGDGFNWYGVVVRNTGAWLPVLRSEQRLKLVAAVLYIDRRTDH